MPRPAKPSAKRSSPARCMGKWWVPTSSPSCPAKSNLHRELFQAGSGNDSPRRLFLLPRLPPRCRPLPFSTVTPLLPLHYLSNSIEFCANLFRCLIPSPGSQAHERRVQRHHANRTPGVYFFRPSQTLRQRASLGKEHSPTGSRKKSGPPGRVHHDFRLSHSPAVHAGRSSELGPGSRSRLPRRTALHAWHSFHHAPWTALD